MLNRNDLLLVANEASKALTSPWMAKLVLPFGDAPAFAMLHIHCGYRVGTLTIHATGQVEFEHVPNYRSRSWVQDIVNRLQGSKVVTFAGGQVLVG